MTRKKSSGKSSAKVEAASPQGGADTERKREILERYSFFREAPEDLKAEIEKLALFASLDAGARFFNRGMSCTHVALVGAGSVRVSVQGETGREITLYRVEPGETCPVNLLSALLERPAPATADVTSALQAVVLPTAVFRDWVAQHDGVRRFVLDAIAARLVDILSLLQEITFGRLDRRLADFLLRGFGQSADPKPVIELTHEKIALELSSAREVITRMLREFETMGAVELYRGRVVLRDKALLATIRGGF